MVQALAALCKRLQQAIKFGVQNAHKFALHHSDEQSGRRLIALRQRRGGCAPDHRSESTEVFECPNLPKPVTANRFLAVLPAD